MQARLDSRMLPTAAWTDSKRMSTRTHATPFAFLPTRGMCCVFVLFVFFGCSVCRKVSASFDDTFARVAYASWHLGILGLFKVHQLQVSAKFSAPRFLIFIIFAFIFVFLSALHCSHHNCVLFSNWKPFEFQFLTKFTNIQAFKLIT